MSNRFEDLVTSPYDDEPGGDRPWLRWLVWAGVAVVAVVVAITALGGGSEDEPLDAEASDSTSSTLVVIAGEAVVAETDEPPEESLPEIAFDTTPFGAEQTLGEIGSGSLADQWDETAARVLGAAEPFVLGSIPESRIDLVGATGTNTNPYDDSFGGPMICIALAENLGFSMDCAAHEDEEPTRPLLSGLLGTGVFAWGFLPEDASIGVLTVDGTAVAWQRPTLGIVAFQYDVFPGETIELVVLSGMGTQIDRGTRHRPSESTKTYVEPITGYGDYSGVAYEDLDFAEVDKQIVDCMIGRDIPAFVGTRLGPHHSIDLSSIPEDDMPEAQEILARCRMGLNLPPRPTPPEDWYQEQHAIYVEIHACLTDLGYEIDPAPPYDEWAMEPVDTRWDPILIMDILFPNRAEGALNECNY